MLQITNLLHGNRRLFFQWYDMDELARTVHSELFEDLFTFQPFFCDDQERVREMFGDPSQLGFIP